MNWCVILSLLVFTCAQELPRTSDLNSLRNKLRFAPYDDVASKSTSITVIPLQYGEGVGDEGLDAYERGLVPLFNVLSTPLAVNTTLSYHLNFQFMNATSLNFYFNRYCNASIVQIRLLKIFSLAAHEAWAPYVPKAQGLIFGKKFKRQSVKEYLFESKQLTIYYSLLRALTTVYPVLLPSVSFLYVIHCSLIISNFFLWVCAIRNFFP
jgi:hypothetical protein